jgi:head-tail adaptor
VKAGVLRARIGLARPIRTADELGGGALSFQTMGEVWADLAPLSTSLGDEFGGSAARRRLRAIIRARGDVRPGWRVSWSAQTFTVIAVMPAMPGQSGQTLDLEEE